MTGAIILAAGNGSRFGGYKQFEKVNGKQILDYTIDIYKDIVDNLIVVMPSHYACGLHAYTVGGKTRYESMCKGFEFVKDCDKILMVDGVRCNTSQRIVEELIAKLDDYDAVCPILPAIHTNAWVVGSEFKAYDKTFMYDIQTPTILTRKVVQQIICKDFSVCGFSFIYCASYLGCKIGTIEGEPENIKITYPYDLELFKIFLERKI